MTRSVSDHPLRPLFEPRSVGVIGASADPGKRGHQVIAALLRSGFAGPIVPVNPRGGEILGLPVARSIDETDEPPELVYVATPAAAVPDVIAACGAAGVKGAIVPAVGFRESGPEGAELERRVVAAARETGIRVVGPNTSGLLNTHAGLHMVGGEPLAPGAIAIVSQSGNVALDLMTAASERPVGVSVYVGPGNECDIGFHEILDFLGQHEPTRAIVMYVEGLRDGRALYETARAVTATKPVVVLKGGRSDAGGRSARSHTGAVAGAYEVFRAAARRSGMIEVDASDELFAVAETLALQPSPRLLAGPGASRSGAPDEGISGFVILSDGGGHATLAADRFAALSVPLARLGADTRSSLRELLGPASSVTNPVDAAGAPDRAPSVLARAIEVAAADPRCAGILVTGLFGGYAIRFASSLEEEEMSAADGIAAAAADAGVPIVVHSLYDRRAAGPLRRLRELGVPVCGSLEIAATCCGALVRRGRDLAADESVTLAGAPTSSDRTPPEPVAIAARDGGLSEVEARALVEARGVPVVPAVHCRTESEVRAALAGADGPWAVKAVSAALPHKTDADAVRLGLATPDEVVVAFRHCVTRAAEAAGGHAVDGALVSEMLPPPLAELLVGARRDPSFGPILTVGFGGIDVEIEPDVAIRLLPATPSDVMAMAGELRGSRLLTGHRGRPAIDLEAVVRTALAVAEILLDDPALAEIELNPVFAYADRIVAVDALARRSTPSAPTTDRPAPNWLIVR